MPVTLFDIPGRVALITGGAGLLGRQHARVVAAAGGIPVLLDLDGDRAAVIARDLAAEFGVSAMGARCNVVDRADLEAILGETLGRFGRIDILINNATNNPKVENSQSAPFSRFETFPTEQWTSDLDVGLKGAFLCSQVFGSAMARLRRGVIVNVASDLSLIAPDQRLYRREGLPEDRQPVKPVTYSVVKAGLLGLTRYLATYWADVGVRVNAISPGGVFDGQSEDFVAKLASLIPLGRMARVDEYQGALLFLISDASSYMTGSNLVIDGGRTCW